MENIDKQLSELYEEKKRKETVATHLDNIYHTIEDKEEKLSRLKIIVDKEEHDVQKLEESSLYSLFLTVLGTHKEKLKKERHEYLQAFMKLQGEESSLQSLQEEKELLVKVYSGLKDVDKEFNKVLNKKIQKLIEENNLPPILNEYTEKIANYKIKISELESCIKKGVVAKKYLRKTSEGLTELKEWGKTSNYKRRLKKKEGRINKDIFLSNDFLQQFENKLIDMETYFDLDFRREITQFENFLDQFVEALITDWIVKHEIFNSNNLTINLIDKLTQLSEMLQYEIENTQEYIQEAKDFKASYIIKNISS